MDNKEIAIIDEKSLKEKIYIIRGQQVMLDSDLATYFNVETKALNRSMKRNIERFPESFCFRLTIEECSRCQIGTLNSGRGSNIKYLPYVYSEQGIAMLTSCLHTKEAITASVEIINAFVEMRRYLYQNKQLPSYRDLYLLSSRQSVIEVDVKEIKETMVNKKDISNLLKLFNEELNNDEILILNGQPFKADLAYQRIFKKAKKSVIIIDSYINTKTLHYLSYTKGSINISIITDNKGKHPLNKADYDDFIKEYPNININFIKALNKVHDRYIVLDNGYKDMKVYLCGSSLKDSGNKITSIIEINNIEKFKSTINELLNNDILELK